MLRYCFLFAHFDDEVLICGTMRLFMDQGHEVHGVWVSACDFFGQGKRRVAEHATATRMLGLPSSQVHLLNLPDIEVVRDLDRTADLVSSVMDRIRPTTIFATAFEGGHPDHDAVNFLAYEGMRRAGLKAELLEFPLYNFTGPMHHGKWRINSFPPTDSPCLYTPLTDRAIDVKYRLMRTYTSQWMYMIPARLACSRSRMTDPGEPYRRYPAVRDHTVRPHEGKLLYEHWFSSWLKTRFEDFSVAVSRSRWCGPE